MKKSIPRIILLMTILSVSLLCFSQKKADTSLLNDKTFSGLKLRSIGPAFKSGRIADIAIHPENENIWYVAVGSGGVWKTANSGTTWEPIFDGEKSYSIGCVTIDPNNPHTVWVGTGENIGGRHVGYGDGIYRSDDGGSSWKNMGLKESQHISKIIVHPENSDVIWVAAQGPLWNKGGERGLYKSADGGKTWKKTLGDEEWTGVTDIVIDPRDPDVLYAATWQRHRNVAAYISGGPGSGIHKSVDGGETWEKLKSGLPGSNMGKIGLAISPLKPDVLYAAIELNRRTGGVYRSDDRGASWKKMSDAVAGATGPHYYQELFAHPHVFDKIFLVDVWMQVSDDGGKTFKNMNESKKHSDNHAIAFSKTDPDYMLVGTDGGLYETFDDTKNWKYIPNLPLTQFYKVSVDDSEPFYFIYGGTQDNGSQGGPSRTDKSDGISNQDWFIINGGDGHQTATEPGNPDIVYAQSQQGYLVRRDMITGETVDIRPQPGEGEDAERFNWDSPILVSPHSPTTIYFASQRVWRSDDRGDSWTAISGDLTRDQERLTLPIMEQTQGWDEAWDMDAMSDYNTITSLAESPVREGLIYAGTDDGLIQVKEPETGEWRKIEVGSMPGIPATAFVNDIKADLFDVNTVYVVLDNHKFCDLNPYLMKSTDRGKSWKSMKGNLPEKTLLWRIVQDHEKPELFFLATEFGICFTVDAGEKWIRLKGGVPTISFRDLAIQKRENDLVGASFGRGFYVFDDYSVLREVSDEQLKQEATLFPVRDAWWYIPRYGNWSQGATFFTAPNPDYGAVFTYYLKESYQTRKDMRQVKESKQKKNKEAVVFPGWEEVEAERREEKPLIILTVKDAESNVIRKLEGPTSKGFHRVDWDLRYSAARAIDIHSERNDAWSSGLMVVPGQYTVSMAKQVNGVVTELGGPVEFEVVRMRKGGLQGASEDEIIAFTLEVRELRKAAGAASIILENSMKKTEKMQDALTRAEVVPGDLEQKLHKLRADLLDLEEKMYGNKSKQEIGEQSPPNINTRLYFAMGGTGSTYGPTKSMKESLEMGKKEFAAVKSELEEISNNRIPALLKALQEAGAPWMEGMDLPNDSK
ncbi:MAG: glycosyl hydrolase [Bacteroidetes bacterium]|nr:glycosyl hydrolase [Bacteroidota bacterium]